MSRNGVPEKRPVVLTIAGSDSGGGAGIQADLKTIEACGGFGTSVITSVTAQHTRGVESTHVLPINELQAQLDAVTADFHIQAVKTGMLATAEIVETVTKALTRSFDTGNTPVVVDPVMVSASGDRLLEREGISAYEGLISKATVVTPNADETAVLTDIEPTDAPAATEAGEHLVDMGADAALIKGGHISGDPVRDILVTPDGTRKFSHPRIDDAATHGSGCTLASAIATELAHNKTIEAAIDDATELLQRAIRYYHDVGAGGGSVHHSAAIRERAARTATAEQVESILEELTTADAAESEPSISRFIPEVGMQIAGATPYAETPTEVAAVEGRITHTRQGIRVNRGVRFGASSHLARLVLAAREYDPTVQFGANCRYDDGVADTLEDLDWVVAEFDRTSEPTPEVDGGTMEWGVSQAFDVMDQTPAVIVDDGAVGKEPMARLLANDSDTLGSRIITLAREISD